MWADDEHDLVVSANPVKRTPEQNAALVSARSLNHYFDQTESLVDVLRRDFPDQVDLHHAAVTANQWTTIYSAHHGATRDAALRAFERWKVRARELGLEAPPGSDRRFYAETTQGIAAPMFVLDVDKVTGGARRAYLRLRELELALGVARREVTSEELAEELGVSPGAISKWVADGLPHARSETGKGRPRLFDPVEVADWIRRHGSPKARGALAARQITGERVAQAIAASSTLREAAESLGLSLYQFAELRRSLGIHSPIPAADRPRAWEALRREELEEVINRHEGRRGPIAEELGFSLYELHEAIRSHGLRDHPFVLHPRSWERPLPFTREQLEESIVRHAGLRVAIAKEFGVSRETLRDAIIDLDLFDHPMLQAGVVPARVARSLKAKTATGAGRGRPGMSGARARGHQHGYARDATLVPFWLAAIREIMARHPGRGGGRATASAIGVSPVTLTNVIQGKRVPGFEVMEQIMAAAGREAPDWREALRELIDRHRNDAERARRIALPTRALDAVSTILGVAPQTVIALNSGRSHPSMPVLQKILEASGRPYLVEAIETPETIAYGGPSGEPQATINRRRGIAADLLRTYRSSGLSWAASTAAVGVDPQAVLNWSNQARQGRGPFVEAANEDPSLLPLPPHLVEGASQPARGTKYGPWRSSPGQ